MWTYVECGETWAIRVEGFVVVLDELLCRIPLGISFAHRSLVVVSTYWQHSGSLIEAIVSPCQVPRLSIRHTDGHGSGSGMCEELKLVGDVAVKPPGDSDFQAPKASK